MISSAVLMDVTDTYNVTSVVMRQVDFICVAAEGFDSVCSRVAESNNDDSLAFERCATAFPLEYPKDHETGKKITF